MRPCTIEVILSGAKDLGYERQILQSLRLLQDDNLRSWPHIHEKLFSLMMLHRLDFGLVQKCGCLGNTESVPIRDRYRDRNRLSNISLSYFSIPISIAISILNLTHNKPGLN